MSGKIVECLYSYFVAMGGQTVSEGSPSKKAYVSIRPVLHTRTQIMLPTKKLPWRGPG